MTIVRLVDGLVTEPKETASNVTLQVTKNSNIYFVWSAGDPAIGAPAGGSLDKFWSAT